MWINRVEKRVYWRLPVSKTDAQALGCTREWACTCLQADCVMKQCPYLTAEAHLEMLDRVFPDADPEALPLFPQEGGEEVPPEAHVKLVEKIALMTGERTLTKDGRNTYGKHSWRSTGAVFLRFIGLEVIKIQLLTRWGSPIITHYTRLVPLKSLAEDFKKVAVKKALEDKMKEADGSQIRLARVAMSLTKTNQEMNKQMISLHAEMAELRGLVRKAEEDRRPPTYVQHPKSGVVHRFLTTLEDAGIHARAICSYKWVAAAARRVSGLPSDPDLVCDACMPEQRAEMANAAERY